MFSKLNIIAISGVLVLAAFLHWRSIHVTDEIHLLDTIDQRFVLLVYKRSLVLARVSSPGARASVVTRQSRPNDPIAGLGDHVDAPLICSLGVIFGRSTYKTFDDASERSARPSFIIGVWIAWIPVFFAVILYFLALLKRKRVQ